MIGRLAGAAALLAIGLAAAPALPADIDIGAAIYRDGVLPSGASVRAQRGEADAGPAPACARCHRRSGLGAREGRNLIPPIAARYLFHARASETEGLDLPFVEGARAGREPYTETSLARAIREGIDSEGRPLDYLMPRFALGDAEMASLIAYLRRLDPPQVPGVTEAELHFATIVTPDADPAARRGMIDVLEHFFSDRNARQRAPTPTLLPSGRTMFSKMMFKANRRWQLHVWQLEGAPATWQAQLHRRLAEQPVLAAVSGLGGADWSPIQAFCEKAALPCLFPNVDAPPAGAGFYSRYFSRGVLLEAELIASSLLADGVAPKSVLQVWREGDVGAEAAAALARAMTARGVPASSLVLDRHASADSLPQRLQRAAAADALVLWLRPADLAALPVTAPPRAVYLSGLMAGLERAPLPAAWRSAARMAMPVDLPQNRRVRVDYALGWFSIRHITLQAPQVQVDTYLACGLLSETLNHMVDNFGQDYLVERMEDMIEHHIVTGYYPHLSLGPGQRFASKGGYLVRFAELAAPQPPAQADWRVP